MRRLRGAVHHQRVQQRAAADARIARDLGDELLAQAGHVKRAFERGGVSGLAQKPRHEPIDGRRINDVQRTVVSHPVNLRCCAAMRAIEDVDFHRLQELHTQPTLQRILDRSRRRGCQRGVAIEAREVRMAAPPMEISEHGRPQVRAGKPRGRLETLI